MKPIICSAVSLLICLISSSALAQNRVLTVDNNQGAVAMFKDFKSAYETARDGDTILLAGSDTEYVVETIITKRLNLVGNGYFLQENNIPGLSSKAAKLLGTAAVGNVVIFWIDQGTGNSSAGSTITGLEFSTIAAGVNITVDRCRSSQIIDVYLYGGARIGRVTIRRSYVNIASLVGAGSAIFNSIVGSISLSSGTIAANCVFMTPSGTQAHELSSISSSIFAVADGPIPTPAGFASRVRGSVTHSMAVAPFNGADFLPAGGDNINGTPAELVFAGTGSADAKWRLRADSPALDKGLNGVDMGAFDGPSPYILSGVPSRPRVTRLVVPSLVTSTSGLKFEVDAQSF